MSAQPKNTTGRISSVIRAILLAGVVGGAFWLGAKALRDAPTKGEDGGPPSPPSGPPPASVFVSETDAPPAASSDEA